MLGAGVAFGRAPVCRLKPYREQCHEPGGDPDVWCNCALASGSFAFRAGASKKGALFMADWGEMPANPIIIRKQEAARRTGLTTVSLWRMEQDGTFPARVLLNPNGSACGYFEHEVTTWILSRIRAGGRRMPAGCRGAEDAVA
jgi:predicted DNA-binding transcriptional regulator AlpA